MSARSSGRVALVSGGGSGIGAATARRLAQDGASVVVLGRRKEPIDRIAAEVGGLAVQGDASVSDHVDRAISETMARYGRLDIVVANAGGGGIGSAIDTDDEGWESAFRANLDSAFVLTRQALPALIESRGSIVMVASLAGLFSPSGAAGYVSSKHAIIGLTRSLARDYGPAGVRVNAVCPGWTRTELSSAVVSDLAERSGRAVGDVFDAITADSPLRRIAEPEEIAQVIAFLASSDASILTGAVIPADGGASTIDAASLAFEHLLDH